MLWCIGEIMMLTYWGRDKMAAIFQMTFSNAFPWMKVYEFWLRFHWSLFLRVQLTIFLHWFRWWHGTSQATSHGLNQLEQLECLRSGDTPTASWLPILLSHIGSQVKRRQSQSYKFKEFAKISNLIWNKHYMRHTFWSCLIRCANMKWIRWVLLKIWSGQDSVHRRTDRQTDNVKPLYPPFNFLEARV